MQKALIPIELNLASNIALRYACAKSKIMDLGLQPIQVQEPDKKAHSSESGWIRRTWEAGLQEAGREEVLRILDGETLDCFIIPQPIVAVGDREEELLKELERNRYDLFVEGAVSNFDLGEFRRLLRSRLYRRMPCPALVVKNLIKSDRILLVLGLDADPERLAEQFGRFFPSPGAEFDLCVYDMDEAHGGGPDQLLAKTQEQLQNRGRLPTHSRVLAGAPEAAAAELRDYGLIVAAVDRKGGRKSPLTEVLGRVPCPLLLCW